MSECLKPLMDLPDGTLAELPDDDCVVVLYGEVDDGELTGVMCQKICAQGSPGGAGMYTLHPDTLARTINLAALQADADLLRDLEARLFDDAGLIELGAARERALIADWLETRDGDIGDFILHDVATLIKGRGPCLPPLPADRAAKRIAALEAALRSVVDGRRDLPGVYAADALIAVVDAAAKVLEGGEQ